MLPERVLKLISPMPEQQIVGFPAIVEYSSEIKRWIWIINQIIKQVAKSGMSSSDRERRDITLIVQLIMTSRANLNLL